MHALFSGHNNVNVVEATESEIRSLMPDECWGCFGYKWEYSIEDDDLTVTLTEWNGLIMIIASQN